VPARRRLAGRCSSWFRSWRVCTGGGPSRAAKSSAPPSVRLRRPAGTIDRRGQGARILTLNLERSRARRLDERTPPRLRLAISRHIVQRWSRMTAATPSRPQQAPSRRSTRGRDHPGSLFPNLCSAVARWHVCARLAGDRILDSLMCDPRSVSLELPLPERISTGSSSTPCRLASSHWRPLFPDKATASVGRRRAAPRHIVPLLRRADHRDRTLFVTT